MRMVHSVEIKEEKTTKIFFLIAAYLVFEYGRPQAFFPPIGMIRPAMIIQLFILYYVAPLLFKFKFKEPQTKSIFILLIIMLPHVFLARNNYWAFNTLKIMFLYFIIYLAITGFVNKYSEIIKLVSIWLAIITVCGTIGILYGGKIPGSSIMGDENDFSLVMNMALSIAFFMGMESKARKSKILYFCASGIFVISTVLSFSRGGFVGLATVGAYCWIKSPKKIISSIIIGSLILLMSLAAPDKYWDEVKSITEENIEEGTGATRWYTWECAWRMFLDYPVFGVGQGNFPWNFSRYEPYGGFKGRMHGGRAAHSVYFTLLPELGIVGTFLFFWITYNTMKESKRIIKDINIKFSQGGGYEDDIVDKLNKIKCVLYGLRGALIGYLVTGIFLSVLYYPHFWLINAIFVSIFKWYKHEIEIIQSDSQTWSSVIDYV